MEATASWVVCQTHELWIFISRLTIENLWDSENVDNVECSQFSWDKEERKLENLRFFCCHARAEFWWLLNFVSHYFIFFQSTLIKICIFCSEEKILYQFLWCPRIKMSWEEVSISWENFFLFESFFLTVQNKDISFTILLDAYCYGLITNFKNRKIIRKVEI